MTIYDKLVQWCLSHRTDTRFPALYCSAKRPFHYAVVDIQQKQGTPEYTIASGETWEKVYERIQELDC